MLNKLLRKENGRKFNHFWILDLCQVEIKL